LRAGASGSPSARAAWEALRIWQAARLARTHAHLLADPETADAAKFFLNDLYAPGDMSRRDALAKRVAPVMAKMLPASALETIADAIELDALSESLDADMVAALGVDIARIDDAGYGRAYRAVAREADRARQIDLIARLGASIERLAHLPFIGATLRAMRKPARLAGFGGAQDFVERGHSAFSKMKTARPFIDSIVSRERAVSRALFAGDDSPLGA
jgi:hypothetical protein